MLRTSTLALYWSLSLLIAPATAQAENWTLTQIAKPGEISTSDALPMAVSCAETKCEITNSPLAIPRDVPTEGGLPDGEIATGPEGANIARAWYAAPTRRYAHAILGDDIEAGRLVVETAEGKTLTVDLPESDVFEDRTPRIIDFDGFGTTHVVTIQSSQSGGGSVAIYGIVDDTLTKVAQSAYIGTRNRWLNIAGIADFDGDGSIQIAAVITPHIGGTLQFWTWKPKADNKLQRSGDLNGFSNHQIGAREQALSAVEDFNDDGVTDIAVPGADRKSLRIVGFEGAAEGEKSVIELAHIPLPGRIDKVMHVHYGDDGVVLTIGLDDGSAWGVWRK